MCKPPVPESFKCRCKDPVAHSLEFSCKQIAQSLEFSCKQPHAHPLEFQPLPEPFKCPGKGSVRMQSLWNVRKKEEEEEERTKIQSLDFPCK